MIKYVKDDYDYIYEVSFSRIVLNEGSRYIVYDLDLVCGRDYISEDSDMQGYVNKNNFEESVQDTILIQYIDTESLEECVKSNGYEIIHKLPTIYKGIWNE